MRIYKRNLGFVSGRYSDMERRLLRLFAEAPERDPVITLDRRRAKGGSNRLPMPQTVRTPPLDGSLVRVELGG